MNRALPQATPQLAKAVWGRQRRPSARSVARALCSAGYPVHFVTVARWKAEDWRPVDAAHPLDTARARLDAVAPLVTGDPRTSIDDLVSKAVDRKPLNALNDGELLLAAARELTIALIVITRAVGERAASLADSKPGELAAAWRSIAACFTAATKTFSQSLNLRQAAPR
jgi:hypothetical protein